jgi:hypothetical protein
MSLNSKGLSKRMASQLSRRNFVAAGTLVIWSFRSGFSAETSPMHNNLVGENSNGSQQGGQAEVQSSQNADVWILIIFEVILLQSFLHAIHRNLCF